MWHFGIVVLISEVAQRWTRLVVGWVTAFEQVNISVFHRYGWCISLIGFNTRQLKMAKYDEFERK